LRGTTAAAFTQTEDLLDIHGVQFGEVNRTNFVIDRQTSETRKKEAPP